jgi:glutathione-regulated potassium-efflux system protein KefB
MMLDLGAIAARPLFVLGLALSVVAVKTAAIFGLARLFGMATRPAVALGLLLSQGGEFGFVLFAQAQAARLIAPEAASLFGAVVTLSMATTPFLMMLSRRFTEPREAARDDLERLDGGGAPPGAIIVGYGRFGQTVGQMLMAKGVPVTLIDSKPKQIDLTSQFGAKVHYGDGTRIDLLRQAGAAEARAIIFCMDGHGVSKRELQPVLETFPQAAVLVRTFDRRHVIALDGLDLAGTVREVFDSAVTMGGLALKAVGASAEEIVQIEEEYRRRDAVRLEMQSRSGDLHAAEDMMFRADRPMVLGDIA